MATYFVKVNEKNLFLTVGRKEFRTPVELEVSEQELNLLKATLNFYGCKNYEVSEIKKKDEVFVVLEEIQEVKEDKEKDLPPSYEEIKSRVFKKRKKPSIIFRLPTIIEKREKPEFKLEKTRTSYVLPFNKENTEIKVEINKKDFEVSIEDLSLTVGKVLEKVKF